MQRDNCRHTTRLQAGERKGRGGGGAGFVGSDVGDFNCHCDHPPIQKKIQFVGAGDIC